jgi:hypothetical protein
LSAADDLRALIVEKVEAKVAAWLGRACPIPPPYAVQQGLAEALLEYVPGSISWKNYARTLASDILPSCTYMDGALIAVADGALPAQAGVTLALGESILVPNQVDATQNGIYRLASLGDGSHPWVLERREDAATGDQLVCAVIAISEGSAAGKAFRCTSTDITIGTTDILWEPWPPTPLVSAPAGPWDAFQDADGYTSNATPATLDSFAPPPSCCIQVEADLVAFDSATPQGGSWRGVVATFRVDASGVVTQIGTTVPDVSTTEGPWGATIDTDGTVLRVQVTGEAAKTIHWKSYAQFRIVPWPSTASGATGPWSSYQNNEGFTGNATPIVIDSFAPPTSCVVQIEAAAVGFDAAGPNGGSWAGMTATFRVDGAGVVTQLGSTVPGDATTEAAWAATIDTDGTDIRIVVTGIAATTIDWKTYMQIRIAN